MDMLADILQYLSSLPGPLAVIATALALLIGVYQLWKLHLEIQLLRVQLPKKQRRFRVEFPPKGLPVPPRIRISLHTVLRGIAVFVSMAFVLLVLIASTVFQPPEKLTIAVAYFSEGQSPEIPRDYTTSNLIFSKLKEIEAQAPGVQVIRLDRVFVGETAAEQARQEGEQFNAAMVIWGDRSAAGPYTKIEAHFAILQPGGGQANPITMEREAFIGGEKVKVGGREVNVDALSEQQDFFFTFGLEEDIAYFAAFTAGLIHYRSEQYDLAVKELEFARDNAPSQPDRLGKDTVLFHLGNAYFAGREVFPDPQAAVDEAIAAWLESAQLDPEEPSTQFNLGVAYYEQGDLDRAIEHWQQTISLDPKVVDAYNNLGVAYNRQQKPDLALAMFQKALEIGGEDAVIRVNLGNLYHDQGNLAEAIAEWEKAKQLDPQNVTAHNNLGVAYRELGQLDKAIAEYQQALDLSPEDPMIHNNLGAAYHAQGNTPEAIAEFQKAVDLDATYIPARINLGIVYYLQGNTVQAVEEWQEAQQVDPQNPRVHTILGAVYYDQGEYDKAIGEWQEALRLGGDDADLYNDLGDAYFANKQWDNAAAAYDKAFTLNPQLVLACDGLATTYIRQDRKTEAVAAQQRCVAANPDSAAAYNNLGRTSYQIGEYEQARQAYETALSKDSTLVEAHEGLGLVYLELEEWDWAQESLETALRLAPARARTHFYLGNLCFAQDKYAEAMVAYQRASELDPGLEEAQTNLVSATYNLGITQAQADQVTAAEETFKQVIALDPSYAEAHFALGNLYLRQERWSEAISAYEEALSVRADFPEAGNNLAIARYNQGMSLYQAGDKPGAIGALRDAVELDPNNVQALIGLGGVYYDQGLFAEAVTSYKQALAFDPSSAEARFGLGNVYLKQQDPAAAITQYQTALDLKPDFPEAQHNLAIAYFNLGLSQLQAGQPGVAVQSLMQAIDLDPTSAQAYLVLGNAHFQQKQWDEAAAAYEEAIRLQADFPEARQNLAVAYFNRGVDRGNAGNASEAIQDFQRVLEITEDPELRSKAEANITILQSSVAPTVTP